MPLTQERLRELLHYNPLTGIFTNRVRRGVRGVKGAETGGNGSQGYIIVMIEGVTYSVHRLAWLYVYGYFPENDIDHVNRDKTDNRIANLREVSRQCNMQNRDILRNNKSGVTGVYWDREKEKWRVEIMADKKPIRLGRFNDFDLAVKARWDAEVKYGFQNCNTYSSAYLYLQNI